VVQLHHVFMLTLISPFITLITSFIILRTLIAISRSNWLFLWIALELNLLRFIPIILRSKKFQETEAAVKYFLAQALGSRLLLIRRISIWFCMSLPSNHINLLLLIALLLKIGIVPCHLWYPSVITSLSWLPALILSTWQKLAPLITLAFLFNRSLTYILVTLAMINSLTGGLIGINQSHLRTIIAYSSITHIGWILSLIAITKPLHTIHYFIMYSLIITPIFIIIYIKNTVNSRNINKILSHSPLTQILIPILLLSLAGLPPLTGFAPKWLAIRILVPVRPYITAILIIGAIINTYFYLNISFNFILSLKLTSKISSLKTIPIKTMSVISLISLLYIPILIII